jgi:CheY-like chemotaxis protein
MNRILIVDDERAVGELTGRLIQELGYSPALHAEDGALALLYLQEHPEIRLIITDFRVPNLDGPGLIAKCRERRFPGKIVLVSGTFDKSVDLSILAQTYAADSVLSKPFLPHHLLDALNRAGVTKELFA